MDKKLFALNILLFFFLVLQQEKVEYGIENIFIFWVHLFRLIKMLKYIIMRNNKKNKNKQNHC